MSAFLAKLQALRPSLKLWWRRAQGVNGSQILMTSGVLEDISRRLLYCQISKLRTFLCASLLSVLYTIWTIVTKLLEESISLLVWINVNATYSIINKEYYVNRKYRAGLKFGGILDIHVKSIFKKIDVSKHLTQPAFTCSKSTMERAE